MSNSDLAPQPDDVVRTEPRDSSMPDLGQWYWVTSTRRAWDEEKDERGEEESYEWFGCVTKVGSNFVQLEEPHSERHGFERVRVHTDEIDDRLRLEPNPRAVIEEEVGAARDEVRKLMGKVQKITERLGVSEQPALEAPGNGTGRELAKLSGTDNVKTYKRALVRAKEKQLPELFDAIKEASDDLATWMAAETLPLKAEADRMKGCIARVDDRIFNVSLYAGLIEDVATVRDGSPAGYAEKLHIMQRRLYMDEECLANYRHGGMSINRIGDFDRWLLKPENLARILPTPRCIAAFRVRRDTRPADPYGESPTLVAFRLDDEDMKTFLYIRNGEQVHRLACDLEFGAMIFPDQKMFDPSEPMMIRTFTDSVEEMVTLREYEAGKAEDERKFKEWAEAHPDKDEYWNPHSRGHYSDDFYTWRPLDSSNVYFDEAMEEIGNRIKNYNRIALIIQGLYDRSTILHPHAPAKLWDAENFEQLITLVYDASNTLYHGEPPDFEAYRAECNSSFAAGCMAIGADDYWAEREAVKECARRDRSWRHSESSRPERFRPYGDDGPGYLAKVVEWKPRARRAVFTWTRERQRTRRWGESNDPLPCRLSVPEARLFNASAYKLGDYKRFFTDSRTRAKYLQWAPMLLAAEEYHYEQAKKKRKRKRRRK